MRSREAVTLAKWVLELRLPQGAVCLNVGSSTKHFREVDQPHIRNHFIAPLEASGLKFIHCDMKKATGVDEVGDILDPRFRDHLKTYRADLLVCSNLLEHLADPQGFARACGDLVRAGGFALFSVPSSYPYHADPIDTMLRASPQDLTSMLPGWNVRRSVELKVGNYRQDLRMTGKPLVSLAKHVARVMMPFYRPKQWSGLASRLSWLFRDYRVSIVVLEKPNIGLQASKAGPGHERCEQQMIKKGITRALAKVGFEARTEKPSPYPVEFLNADVEVLDFVLKSRVTMASPERVVATINACKHAVLAGIEGDFVECGVWRGGNSIAAKLTFENYGSDKKVWLFDTFSGMTRPTEHDTTRFSDKSAAERFVEAQAGEHNEWCFASLEDVQANFTSAGVNLAEVCFVAGDVIKTLGEKRNVPEALCVLRLDTDFYDSTKAELETLYPRLSAGGSLLIDDFGHWDGARRAVEEYLATLPPRSRPLLHYTDYSGRMGIKV